MMRPAHESPTHAPRRRLPSPATLVAFVAVIAAMAGNAFALQANSVRSTHIVDGEVKTRDLALSAVETRNLARRSVKGAKIAPGAVGTLQLAPGAVGSDAVGDGSLGRAELQPSGIGGADLASGAVTGPKLSPTGITSSHFEARSLTGTDLFGGAVTVAKVAGNAVNSSKVVDNSLTGDDINESALGSPLARNRTLHSLETATDTVAAKSLEITCPAGKHLFSGGGRVFSGGITAAIQRSAPVSSTTWRVEAKDPDGGGAWSLLAYAVCVQV